MHPFPDAAAEYSRTTQEFLRTRAAPSRTPRTCLRRCPSSRQALSCPNSSIPVSTSTGLWLGSRVEYFLPRFATLFSKCFSSDVSFSRNVANTSMAPGNSPPRRHNLSTSFCSKRPYDLHSTKSKSVAVLPNVCYLKNSPKSASSCT